MKIRIKGTKNALFFALILPIMAFSASMSVKADIVQNLYEIEMPVEAQGKEERVYIVREALKEILVRASGRSESSAIADDEDLIPLATKYIEQFRYRKFKSGEAIPPTPEGAKPYTQKLWLRFTEKTIANLLRSQGLPVWGKTRPVTLIWLVVDDQKQRILIGNNTPHISRKNIEDEARKKGLPFRLPLLDLADQSKLQVTDVWGNFEDTILDASLRYQTEAVLVGRIYLSFAKTWNTRWTLYSAGQRYDWNFSNSDSLRIAIEEGLSKTGEVLSARFTQVSSIEGDNLVVVKVKNITNLKKYNQVSKYLKSLNVVNDVQAYKINSDYVIFKISSRSGRLGVAQSISLGHKLVTDVARFKPQTEQNTDQVNEQPIIKLDLTYKFVL